MERVSADEPMTQTPEEDPPGAPQPRAESSPESLLQRAMSCHREGRLLEAEPLYRQYLEHAPAHAAALHLFGVLAHQTKRPEMAIDLIGRAVDLEPAAWAYHSNLGNALSAAGQADAAIASYRVAIELKPDAVDPRVNLGNALKRSGRLDEAEAEYQTALAHAPDQPAVHNNLGALYRAQGRLEDAVQAYRRALALRPGYRDACQNLGKLLLDLARPAEAVVVLEAGLRSSSNDAELLCALGQARHAAGQLDPAAEAFVAAIRHRPHYPEAFNRLGLLHQACQRNVDALAAFAKALELQPDYAEVYNNLGLLLSEGRKLPQAEVAWRKALDLSPDFVEARYNLGIVLEEQGQIDDAMAAYRRVLDLDPRFGLAYDNLGRLLSSCQRPEEAAAVYRRWLEVDPQNPVAAHMLAARTGEQVPGRASERYVEKLFDAFAPGFERTLTGLEYRVPELVAAALARVAQRLPPAAVILDAGCGTGLGGERLRPFADRLVGVDLSTGMLAKAREKAVYDELVAGELTAFLRGRPDGFDVVAALDTFNYFGELTELFDAVAGALHRSGLLVFTLEVAPEESGAGSHQLQVNGRYRHSAAYLRDCLAGSGFEILALETACLRMEAGEPVLGHLVTAIKTST